MILTYREMMDCLLDSVHRDSVSQTFLAVTHLDSARVQHTREDLCCCDPEDFYDF